MYEIIKLFNLSEITSDSETVETLVTDVEVKDDPVI